jgi:flagellar basal body P-ring protein FlgI
MEMGYGQTHRKPVDLLTYRTCLGGRSRWLMAATIVVTCLIAGCLTPAVTSEHAELDQVLEQEEPTTLTVGRVTRPVGMRPVKIEGVALVTGLDGTGSDPPPSALRELITSDMQARNVRNLNRLLASPTTALVHVVAYLPPGVQKGDRVDLEVSTPRRTSTTSLQGGWLMETRLKEMAVMGGQVRDGHPRALAEGPVLIDAATTGDDDPVSLKRGRVPGGARSLLARNLGLVVRPSYKSVEMSKRIGAVINTRFHTFDRHGIKTGVATPKEDDFLELRIHPRYRTNIARFIQVIRSIPVSESPTERVARITELEKQLLSPDTAGPAALHLEALGQEGVDVLAKGLQSSDMRVRFHAAEALAYLDDKRASRPLAEAARTEPAFRWHALTALSAMSDIDGFDELEKLLHVDSVETRYGAFRALLARGPNTPVVRGQKMRGDFYFHCIDSGGEPLIHLSRTRRPEVVVFGKELRFEPPFTLFAGKEFIVKNTDGDKVRVSRFLPGEDDAVEQCTTRVDEIVQAIDKLGGSYSHVIELIRTARDQQALACRVVLDANPRPGRKYSPDAEAQAAGEAVAGTNSPLPNLFFTGEGDSDDADNSPDTAKEPDFAPDKAQPAEGLFDRMKGWLAL